MKSVKYYIILFFTLACYQAQARQADNDSVFSASVINSYKLINAGTEQSWFIQPSSKRLILFVFLSPECPLCQNYSPLLNSMYTQYGAQLEVYGIIPGKAYPGDVIKEYTAAYAIRFPVVIDADKKLTTYLHGSVTPQVVLLNDHYEMVYRGAIDDKVATPGKMRVKVSKHYLQDAVDAYLGNNTIALKRTNAVGCKINDY